MKIDTHHSLKLAEKVKTALKKVGDDKILNQLNGGNYPSMWYECFDNCREQGYCIIVGEGYPSFRVAFTENRNSDDIVVYCYRNNRHPSNIPSDGSWDDRKYFRYDEVSECAEYIYQRIMDYLIKINAKRNAENGN